MEAIEGNSFLQDERKIRNWDLNWYCSHSEWMYSSASTVRVWKGLLLRDWGHVCHPNVLCMLLPHFQHSVASFLHRSTVPYGSPCIIDIELVYKGFSCLTGSEMLEGTITTRASETLVMFSDM